MLFWRVKPLDKILETAGRKALTRQLGAFQLTMLGIGAVIGTGIFVLTAEAGQKAGPAMMIAFVIAAVVCALAALAYAELASMVPVSGSAYTYTYGVLGEALAWIVGWALVLEYAVAAGAVSVGWSDIYPADYDRQWINVTGLRGCFAFVMHVDPNNHLYESSERNNRSTRIIRLPYRAGPQNCGRG